MSAVGRPRGIFVASGAICELAKTGSVDSHEIDVEFCLVARDEGDFASIGGPDGRVVVTAAVGQAMGVASVVIHHPYLGPSGAVGGEDHLVSGRVP